MRFIWLMLAAFLLAAPLSGIAAPMQEPDAVQEPDADEGPDDDMVHPKNEPPRAIEEKVKQEKQEKKSPDAKPGENGDTGFDAVILRGLNKVTARSQEIEAPIGSVVRFGTIEIVAHSCWKSAPEDRPENAALLEISEIKQGEPPTQIFLGWMFSSSPGLSSLENPFYDITVVKCDKAKGEEFKK